MKKTIVAFDFDGTLTKADTLLPFLFSFTQGFKKYWYVIRSFPTIFLAGIGLASRQAAKESLMKHFFKGVDKERMLELGEKFSAQISECMLQSEFIQKVRWHQEQGHECIIVSANLDLYLIPWGKKMGFEHVLASRVGFDENGLATGRLAGLNCWGPEKKRRLLEYIREKNYSEYCLYAYGDSRGDEEMLAMADYPVKI